MIGRLQMLEFLHLISTLCFLLAGVSLLVAVILCVLFRIPSIIGLLTGRTACRVVEKAQNCSAHRTVEKAQKSSVHRKMKEILKQSMQTEPKNSVNLPIENILAGGDTEVLYAAYTQRLYTENQMLEAMETVESEYLPEYPKLQVEDEIEFINSEERIAIRSEPIASMG